MLTYKYIGVFMVFGPFLLRPVDPEEDLESNRSDNARAFN